MSSEPIVAAVYLARLLPTPCLLTDETGRCIQGNTSLQRCLPILSGALPGERVAFADPVLQDSWQHALSQGHAGDTERTLVVRAANGGGWKIRVVPFTFAREAAEPAPRQLMISTFERLAPPGSLQHEVALSRSRLTRAELEVLDNLLLGQTAKVIARARGASVNTVRSQITSILGKTGHHTQKELIASIHHAEAP